VRNIIESKKGMTLVELIIAIGLISVIITLGYMFYFTGVRAFDRNVDRADIQQNVRHSISFISKRLLNADEVTTTPKTLTITRLSPITRLVSLEHFRLTETTLRVNHNYPTGPFNPLAENITAFEVTMTDRMITVEISGGSIQEPNSFTLKTQVLLRR